MKQITFKKDVMCKTLCKKNYKAGDAEQMKKLDFLKSGIALNYQNHWYVETTNLSTMKTTNLPKYGSHLSFLPQKHQTFLRKQPNLPTKTTNLSTTKTTDFLAKKTKQKHGTHHCPSHFC